MLNLLAVMLACLLVLLGAAAAVAGGMLIAFGNDIRVGDREQPGWKLGAAAFGLGVAWFIAGIAMLADLGQ